MTYKLNRDKTVAVATDYFWQRIDNDTPTGVKLQLLTVHGVAVYGSYTPRQADAFTHWAPLPKKLPKD